MRGVWFAGVVVLGASISIGAQSENPPMPGFDAEGSDPEAIAAADEVMESLGGRRAWDESRYLTWKFFGRRTHVWDKHSGNLRFDSDEMLVLMNLSSKKGRVWKDGQEVTDSAVLEEALHNAESVWINDSYWVFMPFKLKDSGVTLKYFGKGETADGKPAVVYHFNP